MNDVPNTSLNYLYDYLKRYNLSESLYLLGAINSVFKYGFKRINKDDIPKHILIWLENINGDGSISLQLFLNASRVARFLILSGSTDESKKPLNLTDGSLIKALHLVGELYEAEIEASNDLLRGFNRTMGRISQWQFPLQTEKQTIIGRAYMMFVKIPEMIESSYSIEAKMREYYEIGAFEFMATGMAMWFKTNGTLDYELRIEIENLKSIVTLESQKRFLELSSGSCEEYKYLVRGSHTKMINKLFDIYYLDPFIKIPAIKVRQSEKFQNNTYLVPQPKYLLDRASTGVFYLLADKEQEIAKSLGKLGQNPFRNEFGRIYRTYVRMQLERYNPTLKFVDLDYDIELNITIKIPDFALISGNLCILFEVKTSLLKLQSKTFFDENELKDEIKGGSIKKALAQLSTFREAIKQKKIHEIFNGIDRAMIILVGYEDIFHC